MGKDTALEMKRVRLNCLGVCSILLCIFLVTVSVLYNITYYKREFGNIGSAEKILSVQRNRIAKEMEKFEYSDEDNLAALVPEANGTPYRSIIITSWRSGSTFLGEILNALPGNYYHFEPLLNFEENRIRGPPKAENVLRDLKKLLNCNYTAMDDYLNYYKKKELVFRHNKRLNHYCEMYPEHCLDPNFLNRFCKMFPLQSMKLVRLRLALAEELITDKQLNARVLLLIRDPRGTLHSRKHIDWCNESEDCSDPVTLCNDLVDDFDAAVILSKKYPQQFKAIRYEDLSLNPYNMTKEILHFARLPYHPKVKKFLDVHTSGDDGWFGWEYTKYTTFRDSKSAPFHWIHDLGYDDIDKIQGSCTEAMRLWGYQAADRTTISEVSFNPLLPFTLS